MTKHTNTPELRFPEFKDIWYIKQLEEIGTFKNGINKDKNSFGHGFPFINLNDVFNQDNININNLGLIDSSEKEREEYNLTKGDTLFIRSSVKPSGVGLTKVIQNDLINTVYSGFLIRFRERKKFLEDNFKSYIFSSTSVRKQIISLSSTSANTNINQDSLKKVQIVIPPLIEQAKIGIFFNKLDHQIELEEEKLELLEQQKRGYMQKIFTQELKFENSQLENIKWSYKTLEELNSFFTDGNYGESYPKSEDMSDKNDGVAFLRGSNLKKGRITLEDANYISKKKHSELTTGHLFLDDIVIAVRGSLGAVGYVNENMVGNNINSQLAIIRTSSSLLYGKYLLYYLMSNQGKKELLSRVTGTALKQLPIKQIKQIKVPVPKLHEQHKIANFLSELDNLIDNQTEKMEILKQRKQGLLQKMFV